MREGVWLFVEAEVIWFFVFHEIDGVGGEWDEYNLHDEGVEGLPSKKEVDVPGEKDG